MHREGNNRWQWGSQVTAKISGLQKGAFFVSGFWGLEFGIGSQIFGKPVEPLLTPSFLSFSFLSTCSAVIVEKLLVVQPHSTFSTCLGLRNFISLRPDVIVVVTIKINVSWNMVPCSLVDTTSYPSR